MINVNWIHLRILSRNTWDWSGSTWGFGIVDTGDTLKRRQRQQRLLRWTRLRHRWRDPSIRSNLRMEPSAKILKWTFSKYEKSSLCKYNL
jgi:hypothetical protein